MCVYEYISQFGAEAKLSAAAKTGIFENEVKRFNFLQETLLIKKT